jgi:hypothetical protein
VTVHPFPGRPSLQPGRGGVGWRVGSGRVLCPGWSSIDAAGATAEPTLAEPGREGLEPGASPVNLPRGRRVEISVGRACAISPR